MIQLQTLISGLIGGVIVAVVNYIFSRRSFEYQIMHTERLKVIAEVYRLMRIVEMKYKHYFWAVNMRLVLNEKKIEVFNSSQEFLQYYKSHRLFIDEPICKLLDEFTEFCPENSPDDDWSLKGGQTERDNPKYQDIVEFVKKELIDIRLRIEADFRKKLGISNKDAGEYMGIGYIPDE